MQTPLSHPHHFDCAIIGGGLAGLTLAIQLRKKGLNIILFEKEEFPFHKVCGEYIAMESWNYLEACGVKLSEMNLPQITKLHVSAPNGNLIKHQLNPGGFGISRYTLDNELAKIAKQIGVELLDDTKVIDVQFENELFQINTQNNIYSSKIVLGAYGKRSNLDIKLKRNFIQLSDKNINYVGVKYHVKADLPVDLIELHNFSDGYCGISKVDGESYCLCYLTTADNLKKSGNDIKKMEENILMKNPFLKKYFTEFPVLFDAPLAISQINFSSKKSIENHIIMLGDAAGLITPLCGNGMSMALHASKILSELLHSYFENKLSRDELEKLYSRLWNKQFANRLKVGRIIQSFFGNEKLTNIFISVLKPFPFLVKKLIKLTHGKPF
jgi:flavin-dependent dehydrogenase